MFTTAHDDTITIALIRVSTDHQDMSAADQIKYITDHCAYKGYGNIQFFEDIDTSARLVKLRNRKEAGKAYKLIMEQAHKGVKFRIIATKLDRVFRNVIDGIETEEIFSQLGVPMLFIDHGGNSFNTSTADGRFIFRIFLLNAESEADRTAERTTKAMVQRRQNGHATSHAPWGLQFDKSEHSDKKLSWISESHKEAVIRIRGLYGANSKKASLRTISRIIEGEYGLSISKEGVKNVALSAAYNIFL